MDILLDAYAARSCPVKTQNQYDPTLTQPEAVVDEALTEVTPLAERIRELIAALPIEWQGQVLPVTVSIGVAPTSAPGEAMDRVLARADAAMYAAKRNGRNRVESAAAPDAFYSAAIPQT